MSATASLLHLPLPNSIFFSPTKPRPKPKPHHAFNYPPPPPPPRPISSLSAKRINVMVHCSSSTESDLDCIGNGTDVECFVPSDSDPLVQPASFEIATDKEAKDDDDGGSKIFDWLLLISPFFFWGTAMVAMKEVLPKTGPFFVASFRLIPAGALLVGFAAARGRKQPAGALAWVSIALFAAVDAACFQVGLGRR